jgi:biopolymer transport protein ExbB
MIRSLMNEMGNLAAQGGWVFWCLLALAFGIAFALLSIWHFLRLPDAPVMPAEDWRQLLGDCESAPELLGELRGQLCLSGGEGHMTEIDGRLFSTLERRIPFAFVLIGAAPLIGLLGTVSGMFTTFDGLAGVSSTGPVDVVSKGVSEALITTQTGLVISVPAFIVCWMLKGRYEHLRNSFRRLEASMKGVGVG